MTEKKTDQQFIDAVRSVFDQGVEQVDAVTLSKLDSIRHAALESGAGKFRRWIYYPAGAFVTASLAVVILNIVQPDSSALKAEDIDILSTSEGLDMYEDLEFYQWLEEYEISA